jgi:AcrR family transcriptional regulator
MAKAEPTGLRERKKARTRATIQREALRLFRENGYYATTVDQIIEAAEVSQSTFFRYFRTKEDVLLNGDFDRALVDALAKQPPDLGPIAAMRATFREVFGALTAAEVADMRARVHLVLATPALRARMLDQLAQAIDLMAGGIVQRAGRDSDAIAARALAGAAVGAIIAILPLMTTNPSADLAALVDDTLRHLEVGIHL